MIRLRRGLEFEDLSGAMIAALSSLGKGFEMGAMLCGRAGDYLRSGEMSPADVAELLKRSGYSLVASIRADLSDLREELEAQGGRKPDFRRFCELERLERLVDDFEDYILHGGGH